MYIKLKEYLLNNNVSNNVIKLAIQSTIASLVVLKTKELYLSLGFSYGRFSYYFYRVFY